MTTRAKGRGDEGVTLVELLVVIVLIGIIGGIVSTSLIVGMRSTRQAQNQASVEATLQAATERIARDVRAANPIVSGTATSLTVKVLTVGGSCDHETTYAVSPTTEHVVGWAYTGYALTQSVQPSCTGTATVHTLITAVPSTLQPFSYYDATHQNQLSSGAGASQVEIALEASPAEGRAAQAAATDVDVRNDLS